LSWIAGLRKGFLTTTLSLEAGRGFSKTDHRPR